VTESPTPEWRPVIAALMNDTARTTYARIVLGEAGSDVLRELSPSRARRVRDVLVSSGLVEVRGDELIAGDRALRELLSAGATARPTGPERYLGADGRIDRYPAKASERHALLQHVAASVLSAGEVVPEPELNARLERFTADVAALRRFLVDAALVERTRSGSRYALAVVPPAQPRG
jgi:hypothetical protein